MLRFASHHVSVIILLTYTLLLSVTGPVMSGHTNSNQANFRKRIEDQAELFRKAAKLLGSNQPQAINMLSEAVKTEREVFKRPTHMQIFFEDLIARLHFEQNNLPAAKKQLFASMATQTRFLTEPGNVGAGKAGMAIKNQEEALALRRKVLGKTHVFVGLTFIDLALSQERAGQTKLALTNLREAVKILRPIRNAEFMYDAEFHADRITRQTSGKKLTPQEPSLFAHRLKTMQTEAASAELAEKQGDAKAALEQWLKAIGNFHGFDQMETFTSETLLEHARSVRSVVNRLLASVSDMELNAKDENGRTPAQNIYYNLSNFKGLVFTYQQRIRLERRAPNMRPVFDAHTAITRRLQAELGKKQPDKKSIGPLTAHKMALESELSRRHSTMGAVLPAVVEQQLPAGTVLIDYFIYERRTKGKQKQPERRLACFVCKSWNDKPDRPVVFRDLGPMEPIEKAIRTWRVAIQNRAGIPRGDFVLAPQKGKGSEAPHVLRKLIWEPLLSDLGKAKVILISPDGVLSLVPFPALPGSAKGKYLLEEVTLVMAPVPRLINRKQLMSFSQMRAKAGQWPWVAGLPAESKDTPLLVGDVDFSTRLPDSKKGLESTLVWQPLPGTAKEINRIEKIYKQLFDKQKPEMLRQEAATEKAFRQQAAGHRLLHLATHGLFRRESVESSDNAELRSAVVFAGANHGSERSTNDGLLTAFEIGSIDLGNVDLVVLSACETGVGKTQEGEGVLGLQRALMGAGVGSTVSTLWSVDDAGTSALMVEFYRNLWQKKLGRAEALRQAQLSMLRGKLYRPAGKEQNLSPYYWAGFAFSGDWQSARK